MNTRLRVALVAPNAFKMPMSRVFTITIMIRLLTMPNEATNTIRMRMTNMAIFSSFRAAKRFLLVLIQSRAKYMGPSSRPISWASPGAWYRSLSITSMPVTPRPKPKKR